MSVGRIAVAGQQTVGAVSHGQFEASPGGGGQPPAVTTGSPPRNLQATQALLWGTVNPRNTAQVQYLFEFRAVGGNWVAAAAGNVTGFATLELDHPLPANTLIPNTNYEYRLSASGPDGATSGNIVAFTTPLDDSASSLAEGEPDAATRGATSITVDSATIGGTVTPNDAVTSARFEYRYDPGPSPGPSFLTSWKVLGAGATPLSVSADITGLPPDTLVEFRVEAANIYGTVFGAWRTFTTRVAPPTATAPTIVTLPASAIGPTSATLHGSVDNNLGSTPGTLWYFEYGPDSDAPGTFRWSSLGGLVSGDDPQDVTSDIPEVDPTQPVALNGNTTYRFRLRGSNSEGESIGSTLTFTTDPNPGSPPTVVTGSPSNITDVSVVLSGTVTPNQQSTTAKFQFWFADLPIGPNNQRLDVTPDTGPLVGNGTSPVPLTATIPGAFWTDPLTARTRYSFRLQASNTLGTTIGNTGTFTTKATPGGGGIPPVAVTTAATNALATSVVLNGTVDANDTLGDQECQWRAEWGTDPDPANWNNSSQFQDIGGTDPVDVFFVASGLTPETDYHYRIVAAGTHGVSNGDVATFTTAASGGGSPPVVNWRPPTTSTGSTIHFHLEINPNGTSTDTDVEYLVSGTWTTLVSVDGLTGSSLLTRQLITTGVLSPLTSYTFRAVSTNFNGTTITPTQNITTSAAGAGYGIGTQTSGLASADSVPLYAQSLNPQSGFLSATNPRIFPNYTPGAGHWNQNKPYNWLLDATDPDNIVVTRADGTASGQNYTGGNLAYRHALGTVARAMKIGDVCGIIGTVGGLVINPNTSQGINVWWQVGGTFRTIFDIAFISADPGNRARIDYTHPTGGGDGVRINFTGGGQGWNGVYFKDLDIKSAGGAGGGGAGVNSAECGNSGYVGLYNCYFIGHLNTSGGTATTRQVRTAGALSLDIRDCRFDRSTEHSVYVNALNANNGLTSWIMRCSHKDVAGADITTIRGFLQVVDRIQQNPTAISAGEIVLRDNDLRAGEGGGATIGIDGFLGTVYLEGNFIEHPSTGGAQAIKFNHPAAQRTCDGQIGNGNPYGRAYSHTDSKGFNNFRAIIQKSPDTGNPNTLTVGGSHSAHIRFNSIQRVDIYEDGFVFVSGDRNGFDFANHSLDGFGDDPAGSIIGACDRCNYDFGPLGGVTAVDGTPFVGVANDGTIPTTPYTHGVFWHKTTAGDPADAAGWLGLSDQSRKMCYGDSSSHSGASEMSAAQINGTAAQLTRTGPSWVSPSPVALPYTVI